MAQPERIADSEVPGDILKPDELFNPDDSPDELAGFGEEITRPPKPDTPPADDDKDKQRFQYWQSEADKAKAELKKVQDELKQRAQFDPLIDVLKKDDEAYQYLRDRLSGKPASSAQPMEAPQRPADYNEVEAYSNPESTSFKYRMQEERYLRDQVQNLQRQNQELFQREEQQRMYAEQKRAQREQMERFRKQAVELGVKPEEFPDFVTSVNSATTEDLVSFFNWKKGLTVPPEPEQPSFGIPGRSASPPGTPPGRPTRSPRTTDRPLDIGGAVVDLSRHTR